VEVGRAGHLAAGHTLVSLDSESCGYLKIEFVAEIADLNAEQIEFFPRNFL
jgi:predicted ATP-grasp superfamily ATP-dependent carboligase